MAERCNIKSFIQFIYAPGNRCGGGGADGLGPPAQQLDGVQHAARKDGHLGGGPEGRGGRRRQFLHLGLGRLVRQPGAELEPQQYEIQTLFALVLGVFAI